MRQLAIYKCGHLSIMPRNITTDRQAERYARWAREEAVCLRCHNDRKADEAHVHASENLYAELEGSDRQINWALRIRHQKLDEIDLARTTLECLQEEPARRERLRTAHYKLAMITSAENWIDYRDLSIDELILSCLESASA